VWSRSLPLCSSKNMLISSHVVRIEGSSPPLPDKGPFALGVSFDLRLDERTSSKSELSLASSRWRSHAGPQIGLQWFLHSAQLSPLQSSPHSSLCFLRPLSPPAISLRRIVWPQSSRGKGALPAARRASATDFIKAQKLLRALQS